MKKFLPLVLAAVGTAMTAGLIQLIFWFGQHPIGFRSAVGISLLMSLYDLRNIRWDEVKETGTMVEDAFRGIMAGGFFALFVLVVWVVFSIF